MRFLQVRSLLISLSECDVGKLDDHTGLRDFRFTVKEINNRIVDFIG